MICGQQQHVVTTVGSVPETQGVHGAQGVPNTHQSTHSCGDVSPGGGDGVPPRGVIHRMRKIFNRDMLVTLAMGQLLSLLLCTIGVTSKLIAVDYHAHTPVFQSFLCYILLFLVYTTTLAVRQGEQNLLAILKRHWWKYLLVGVVDMQANFLLVKAYQYTPLSTVTLLDFLALPVVLLLSWYFLSVRYRGVHVAGVCVCVLGLACTVGGDVHVGRDQLGPAGDRKLVGDLLVVGGATLYGISNVWEEFVVKNLGGRVEFLGLLGLFGSFFSGIQLAIMEHKELLKVPWDWQIGLLYSVFSACMFSLYSLMPVVMRRSGAASVNLSLLTADTYCLLCGLLLFHYKFSGLYLLSLVLLFLGLLLYGSASTYVAPDPRVYKKFHNAGSHPAMDTPPRSRGGGATEPSVTYTSLGQEVDEEACHAPRQHNNQ